MNKDQSVSDPKLFLEGLDLKIWKTKGSRFNAFRRLKKQNELSIGTISWLSIYVILITVMQLSGIVRSNDYVSVTGLFLALVILILSLMEASKNYQARALDLYSNANAITKIYAELQVLKLEINGIGIEGLVNLSNRYSDLLEKCEENHENIDFDLFKTEHAKEFNINTLESWRIKIIYWVRAFGVYWLYRIGGLLTLIILFLFERG